MQTKDIKVKNKKIFNVLAFILLGILLSCNTSKVDYNTYLKYLADPENGLTKERTTHGIKLKVKYLPVDYLVYNAFASVDSVLTEEEQKKIKISYANSLTFMLTLGPADNESFSITKIGVENYQQFAERIETMSFNMKEYFTLEANGKEIMPELVQLETINTQELSKNLIVVFKALDEQGKSILNNDITFTYNDELFYTGINKFVFKADNIKALPELVLQPEHSK